MPTKPQHHQARLRLESLESRQLLSNSPSAALFIPPMMADDGAAYSFALTSTSVTEMTIVSLPPAGEQVVSWDVGRLGDGHAVWGPMTEGRPLGNDDFSSVGRGDDFSYVTGFTTPQYSFGWFGWQEYDNADLSPPPSTRPLGGPSTPANPSGNIPATNNLGDDSYSRPTPPLSPTRGSLLGQGTPVTPAPAAPVNNAPIDDGPIDTGTSTVKFVVEQLTGPNTNVLAVSEPSSLSGVSPARTQIVSAKQTSPVIAVSDATISSSVHSTPVAGSVTTTADRIVPVGSLPGAQERRLADSANASSPFTAPGGNLDDAPGLTGNSPTPAAPPPTGSETLPPPQTAGKDGNATEDATPALDSSPLPLPQGADLLDGELLLGLAGLESALRALTGSQATGRANSNLLMRCLVIGSWVVSAALAWTVIRRRSSLPESGLGDALSLGRSGPPEEELS
jgi:hypothetical protein